MRLNLYFRFFLFVWDLEEKNFTKTYTMALKKKSIRETKLFYFYIVLLNEFFFIVNFELLDLNLSIVLLIVTVGLLTL